MGKRIRIGTRGSKLALVQARTVADRLREAHPGLVVDIIEIKTSGDWRPEQGEARLDASAGGKGQFAKEIEEAMLRGEIDCGVHSMKDMETNLPDGLVIDHMLPREDARDAFLSNEYRTLADLPAGAKVGTASVRRQAFILAKRPDLIVEPLRGNVPTRIEKLRNWQVDATLLAMAGLNRLGLAQEAMSVFDVDEIVPAAGQGAVGIETIADDAETRALFTPLHCVETGLRVKAERAALAVLDGSCRTPIGAHAVMQDNYMHLHVMVCSPDGKQVHETRQSLAVNGSEAEAERLGRRAGEELRAEVDPALLAS